MRFRRFYKQMLRRSRGSLVAAAALCFFVAAVGVPLPTGRTKDRSVAFPCMDRTCGCHDAAGCKAHCCCFTSEEKLAWAAQQGVDPTPFVDDRALSLLADTLSAADAAGCHGDTGPSLHVTSCCAKKVSRQPSTEARNDREHAADHADGLLTIAAYRQCTGLQPLWTLVGAALPPPERVACDFEWVATGHVAQQTVALTIVCFSPPTPPPRA